MRRKYNTSFLDVFGRARVVVGSKAESHENGRLLVYVVQHEHFDEQSSKAFKWIVMQ